MKGTQEAEIDNLKKLNLSLTEHTEKCLVQISQLEAEAISSNAKVESLQVEMQSLKNKLADLKEKDASTAKLIEENKQYIKKIQALEMKQQEQKQVQIVY